MVRIIDHFSVTSGQYLVMELVRGIDLGVLLKQRGHPGLPVDQAIEYVRQACEALSTCTTSRSCTVTSSRRT